jgi:biopolymer transport protein ExbB/TolQ
MNAESKTMHMADGRNILATVGQKYTNVPLLPSLIVSLAGGSASIAMAYLLKGYFPHFYSLIMERGPLQWVTIYAFWFTVGMLIFKYKNLKEERSAFHLDFIRSFTTGRDVIGNKSFVGIHAEIEENLDPRQKDLILVSRINKAIKQIRINNNPADVANVLKTVAETDAAIVDSSYILIKFMIWAIPVLGFIGTIMGMTQAIGSFDVVLKGISEVGFAGVKQNLGFVTSGLSVAFETTFLALILSSIVNLFSNGLQKKEEDLLSDVEEFTTDNIINKYSSLKDQITGPFPKEDILDSQKEFASTAEGIVRELKNMNKQNQVHADEMMSQVGRVIEAIDSLPKTAPEPAGLEGPQEDLRALLQEIGSVLKDQAELIKEMTAVSAFVQKNMESMEKLPDAILEMKETSRKLGALLSKIYNRSFA